MMMSIEEAIHARRSVRKYKNQPIANDLVALLQQKVCEVNAQGGLHVQLVTDEPLAFKGKMAYGTFSGVSNYFAMIGPKSDLLDERIGYYGERLVLAAKQNGIDSCWVGLTFNKVKNAYVVGDNEKLCCLIALGYGDDAGRNLKRKSPTDVSNIDDSSPEWFRKGVEAALLAPTAVNQQKFRFDLLSCPDGQKAVVKASRGFSLLGYTRMDLGIAKCHFEIGAGSDNFVWA